MNNASAKSVLILEGALIFGVMMHDYEYSATYPANKQSWDAWCNLNPEYIDAAKRLQDKAFTAALNV